MLQEMESWKESQSVRLLVRNVDLDFNKICELMVRSTRTWSDDKSAMFSFYRIVAEDVFRHEEVNQIGQ